MDYIPHIFIGRDGGRETDRRRENGSEEMNVGREIVDRSCQRIQYNCIRFS